MNYLNIVHSNDMYNSSNRYDATIDAIQSVHKDLHASCSQTTDVHTSSCSLGIQEDTEFAGDSCYSRTKHSFHSQNEMRCAQ
jgi:hypothetical protein